MVRASAPAEKAGIPSASLVCEGFVQQGIATGAGLGLRNLPMVPYPGQIMSHSLDELRRNVETAIADQVVRSLTVQPAVDGGSVAEPGPADTIFRGSFEEVNAYFYANGWTDGLPIVPPTIRKVEEFLKFAARPATGSLGSLLPDKREATIWNVAVNGVMAGCRPEYMPVLVALVEAMADPAFGLEHLGHTPGTEVLITINGPIVKELGFNDEQGALRTGFQATSSIGRFWRLYLTNVAGFLPHKTDKGTFGGTWRVVLAENEDALRKIGWPPMSVDQGFQAGDNVVTVNSCTSSDVLFAVFGVGQTNAESILDRLAIRTVDIQIYLFNLALLGPGRLRPQIVLSPCVADAIARGGYSKAAVRDYLYQHARFPASRWDKLRVVRPLHRGVERGDIPRIYAESSDPDRLVPIVWSPEDFLITVSGDPGRDNCFICGQNGFIGYPVSKKIALPEGWNPPFAGA
ncbi:MAG: hypothetical protein HYY32_03575 [Chloroflexi bacterium]|nr:hypothetical protein [Chloroflexota bacterium]